MSAAETDREGFEIKKDEQEIIDHLRAEERRARAIFEKEIEAFNRHVFDCLARLETAKRDHDSSIQRCLDGLTAISKRARNDGRIETADWLQADPVVQSPRPPLFRAVRAENVVDRFLWDEVGFSE